MADSCRPSAAEGGDAVLACCKGKWEPLIGVYPGRAGRADRAADPPGPAPVRRLIQSCDARFCSWNRRASLCCQRT